MEKLINVSETIEVLLFGSKLGISKAFSLRDDTIRKFWSFYFLSASLEITSSFPKTYRNNDFGSRGSLRNLNALTMRSSLIDLLEAKGALSVRHGVTEEGVGKLVN